MPVKASPKPSKTLPIKSSPTPIPKLASCGFTAAKTDPKTEVCFVKVPKFSVMSGISPAKLPTALVVSTISSVSSFAPSPVCLKVLSKVWNRPMDTLRINSLGSDVNGLAPMLIAPRE